MKKNFFNKSKTILLIQITDLQIMRLKKTKDGLQKYAFFFQQTVFFVFVFS